jgi:hypothetical protein
MVADTVGHERERQWLHIRCVKENASEKFSSERRNCCTYRTKV